MLIKFQVDIDKNIINKRISLTSKKFQASKNSLISTSRIFAILTKYSILKCAFLILLSALDIKAFPVSPISNTNCN